MYKSSPLLLLGCDYGRDQAQRLAKGLLSRRRGEALLAVIASGVLYAWMETPLAPPRGLKRILSTPGAGYPPFTNTPPWRTTVFGRTAVCLRAVLTPQSEIRNYVRTYVHTFVNCYINVRTNIRTYVRQCRGGVLETVSEAEAGGFSW